MRIERAQLRLAFVFLGGLVLNAVLVAITYTKGAIYSEDLRSLLTSLAGVYSVPLASVLGGIFGQRESAAGVTPPATFWLAFGVALLWNFLLILRSVMFAVAGFGEGAASITRAQDSVEEFSTYITTVSAATTFLVAGLLTYFFAKRD